jgi:lysophospholipase L1-like esterase
MNRIATLIALFGVAVLTACSSAKLGKEQVLYMAVGASDAVGVGAIPLTHGYVYRIEDGLQDRGKSVRLLNLGIPDADLNTIAEAVRVGALRLGARPDLVTIWVGANDIIDGVDRSDFEAELAKLLDDLRDKTKAFIVIADIPDLTQLPRFRANPQKSVNRERIAAFNDAIERQADKHHVPVVKLSEEPVEDRYVSDIDGFHPSDEGHRRIANLFLAVILPEVAERDRGREIASFCGRGSAALISTVSAM